MPTETVIFIGVAIYMVMMIGVGLYASKKSSSVTDFMVAGRSLPLPICTMTVMATWFGGAMMLGGAGAAYEEGMYGVIEDPWGGALALILIGLFFARIFRRLKIVTVVDFMHQRFGAVAAGGITVTTLVSNVMWMAGMLVAFGTIFDSLTNIPVEVGIVAGAIIVFIYTAVGGMWAVAITDFIQMCVIIVGLIVLAIVVWFQVGGWSEISPHLSENTFQMFPTEHTRAEWLDYLRAWTIIGLVDIQAQTLFQRVSAAKSERVAQNAFYLGGIGYLGFAMIPIMLGIVGSVVMPGLDNPEFVIPEMAKAYLHPVAIAILVGAMLSAIMSSADSCLLACGSVASRNILPVIVKEPSARLSLLVARWSIPFFGLIGVLIAIKVQVVFDLMVDANILGLACIIVPFILGVWWQKANRTGALAGMFSGLAAWMTTNTVAPHLASDFIGLATSLVVMVVVTLATQTFDPPRPLVDSDGNPVDTRNRLGTLPLFSRKAQDAA
ncbi:MAG: sodium:solute symporter family protein [Pseudomonadota bacterium]